MSVRQQQYLILLMTISLIALTPGFSQAQVTTVDWIGDAGDNDWLNEDNWLPELPLGTDYIVRFDTAEPDQAIHEDGTNLYRTIRIGINADGQLDVYGGHLRGTETSQVFIGQNGNTGTLNIFGGEVEHGHVLHVGEGEGSVGIVNHALGIWRHNRGFKLDDMFKPDGGEAEVSIAVGTSSGRTASGDTVPGATGTVNVFGDAQIFTRFGILLGDKDGQAGATWHVDGGTSVANVGGNEGRAGNSGSWTQRSEAVLKATVDGAGDLGTINILEIGEEDHFVNFDDGSVLDLGFGADPIPGSWDLMNWAPAALFRTRVYHSILTTRLRGGALNFLT